MRGTEKVRLDLERWVIATGCPLLSPVVSAVKLSPSSTTRSRLVPMQRFDETTERTGAGASDTASGSSSERVPSGFLTETERVPGTVVPAVPPRTWATSTLQGG